MLILVCCVEGGNKCCNLLQLKWLFFCYGDIFLCAHIFLQIWGLGKICQKHLFWKKWYMGLQTSMDVVSRESIFFGNKGSIPRIWGHQHTHSIDSTHTTLFSFRWVNSQSEADQNIHSFNCFIQPASPWITYVAPNNTFPLSPILPI